MNFIENVATPSQFSDIPTENDILVYCSCGGMNQFFNGIPKKFRCCGCNQEYKHSDFDPFIQKNQTSLTFVIAEDMYREVEE